MNAVSSQKIMAPIFRILLAPLNLGDIFYRNLFSHFYAHLFPRHPAQTNKVFLGVPCLQ